MEWPSERHHRQKTSHLAWYPAREDGRRAKDTCCATRLEKPRARVNRWIVSKHEATAWTPPDGSGAGAGDLWTEEELQARPLPDPADLETTASEANKVL